MPDDMQVVASLGADIRSLRKARKLTLVALADALDRSVGWLSQVERGKSKPRMADLLRMAEVLDVSINSFLKTGASEGEEGLIVRAASRRPIGNRTKGLVEGLLSPDLTDDFEVIHSSFAPHSALEEPLTRPTQEVCFVIRGRFEIWIDDQHFRLVAGDSFRLRGQSFRWANPYDETCDIVWVMAPPIY